MIDTSVSTELHLARHRGGATVGSQLLRALRRYPDRIAFAWDGGSMTYAHAVEMVGRYQRVFADRGLRPRATVAILTANRADAWCAGLAAQASALRVMWLHPIGSLTDHLEQLDDVEAEALIVDADSFGERGGELASQAPSVRLVFTLGEADYGENFGRAASAASGSTATDLAEPTDVAVINFTGGTTGRSKGVVRSHGSATAMTNALLADIEFPRTPKFLAVAPISHAAGTKIGPVLLLGGTIHLLPKFDPDRVLATIERERIDSTLVVPTMVYVLLDHPQFERTDLSSLELLLYGASPMSPTRLAEGLARIGPVFSQFYGQSECHPIAVLHRADHDTAHPELFAAAGMTVASCALRLIDDDGHDVAPGDAGEIGVRAPQAMDGYWKRPEQTAETIRNGWVMTGDIALLDERGYLFIVDRKKDMIVSGGFNVYPRTVEDALTEHPDVAMAAVFGIPDEKWGEAVMALVVPRSGAPMDADALVAHVRALRGATCAPKRVEFAETLPLTAIGKVDKKALRATYWSGRDRAIG